jgi:hypothetical protein
LATVDLLNFSQVFGWVFEEFPLAWFAAEFDFLPLIDQPLFVPHGTKIVVGNNTGF